MKSKVAKPILGYSDKSTVKLDYDNVSYGKVKKQAQRIKEWFKLEGFIILKSSKNSYHVVFDKPVVWSTNMEVMCWACFINRFHLNLVRYLVMQGIKQDSTLRIGNKRRKRIPQVVYAEGRQDNRIRNFLEYRRQILEFMRNLNEKKEQ